MFQDLNPLDKPTAMLEIIVMVAGAALIGFFLGWLFQKLQRDKIKADLRFTNDKLTTLQGKADSSVKEQSELKRMVEDLRSRKDALFSELEAQKSETQKLAEQLEAVPQDGSEKFSSMKAEIDKLKTDRKAMLSQIEELNARSEDPVITEKLTAELATAREEREILQAKFNELSSDNTNLEKIERLKSALSSSNEEQQRLRNQVETLSHNTAHMDEVKRLQEKIASLETERSDMQSKLDASKASNHSELEEETNTLKEEVQKLDTKYKMLEEEYEELEEKLNDRPLTPSDPKEIAELRLQVAALENEKQAFQERIASLERLEPQATEAPEPAQEEPIEANTSDDGQLDPKSLERPDASLTYEDYQFRKKTLLANVGTATEAQKDSFSKIVGIGPFIEAKLNSIGIFTYEQIARLKEEDIDHVTRLIEFFPGRIERDGWVRQANKLINKRQEEDQDDA